MRYQSEYLDLTFALNTGVAFSMLSFFEHYLKYLHLAILLILFGYLFWQKEFLKEHIIAFGLMLGAGVQFYSIALSTEALWICFFGIRVLNLLYLM